MSCKLKSQGGLAAGGAATYDDQRVDRLLLPPITEYQCRPSPAWSPTPLGTRLTALSLPRPPAPSPAPFAGWPRPRQPRSRPTTTTQTPPRDGWHQYSPAASSTSTCCRRSSGASSSSCA